MRVQMQAQENRKQYRKNKIQDKPWAVFRDISAPKQPGEEHSNKKDGDTDCID